MTYEKHLDNQMNDKILHRLGRPDMYSKDNLARMYLKSNKSLVGIAGDERTAIQKALVEFQDNKQAFVDYLAGKYDRSEAQWGNLFDNEMHVADEAATMLSEARKGKTTKTWVLGDSKSGPCDACAALAAENQNVPIGEAYSNGEKLAYVHPGCCCSSEYSEGSDAE